MAIATGRGQVRARVEGSTRPEREEEQGGGHAAQDAERGVQTDLPGSGEREGGHVEDRVAAEGGPGQQRGRRRRDGEGGEGLEGEAAQDDLHREEGGPERRVVRAGEAGGDAAGHEQAPLAGGDAEAPPDARGGGRGHEDDGPFAADGARRGLGHERGGGPHEGGAQGQDAVAQDHGLEDVPPARPARPARAEGEHQPGEKAPERRDRQRAPPAGPGPRPARGRAPARRAAAPRWRRSAAAAPAEPPSRPTTRARTSRRRSGSVSG